MGVLENTMAEEVGSYQPTCEPTSVLPSTVFGFASLKTAQGRSDLSQGERNFHRNTEVNVS